MDQIPKSLIVVVVFAAAIIGILYFRPQYSSCDAQTEIFRKNMRGEIFPTPAKRLALPPRLRTSLSECKAGNTPGSCQEMFETLKKLNRQIRNFPESCYETLGSIPEVKGALEAGLALMVQLAWGESPPEGPETRARWFEPADLATFCEVRNHYIRLFSMEKYDSFRLAVSGQLPGEEPQWIEGKCANCEFRKKARDAFSPDEIWKRSLFSVTCSKYL